MNTLLLAGFGSILFGWSATISAGVVLLPTDISVEATSTETTNLQPGDRITFDLSVTNLGPEPANGLLINTSPIFDEVDVFSISTENCAGATGIGVADLENSYYYIIEWHPGPLGADIAVGQTLSCTIGVDYNSAAPSVFPVTFEFSSYLTDLNPSNNAATVTLHRAPTLVTAVPASSPIGSLSLMLLLLAATTARHAFAATRSKALRRIRR